MPITATEMYVARGMVRSGFRASERNTVVDSKPMNPAIAIIRPTPIAPEKTFSGRNGSALRPSAPPRPTTTTSMTTTIAISATSRIPRALELSSMLR